MLLPSTHIKVTLFFLSTFTPQLLIWLDVCLLLVVETWVIPSELLVRLLPLWAQLFVLLDQVSSVRVVLIAQVRRLWAFVELHFFNWFVLGRFLIFSRFIFVHSWPLKLVLHISFRDIHKFWLLVALIHAFIKVINFKWAAISIR